MNIVQETLVEFFRPFVSVEWTKMTELQYVSTKCTVQV